MTLMSESLPEHLCFWTSDPDFLGFKRTPSGKLDSLCAGFSVWSDWPSLYNLCCWADAGLRGGYIWRQHLSKSNCECLWDTSASMKKCLKSPLGGTTTNAAAAMGWLTACLPAADHSVSRTLLKNVALNVCVCVFTVCILVTDEAGYNETQSYSFSGRGLV